jgi:hypothetical protein
MINMTETKTYVYKRVMRERQRCGSVEEIEETTGARVGVCRAAERFSDCVQPNSAIGR